MDRDEGKKPEGREQLRRGQRGFTLLELLIVVAIIGLLASMAIPQLQRALLKAKISRFSKASRTLQSAFIQYHIDDSLYPSTSTPAERAFNKSTLQPLVSRGYIKEPSIILRLLQSRRVTSYDSPNDSGSDSEYWAILTMASYPAVQIVVADSNDVPGFEGTPIEGCYFIHDDELVNLDENILDILAG